MFKITTEVITGAEVREAVEGPDAGAVVLFLRYSSEQHRWQSGKMP